MTSNIKATDDNQYEDEDNELAHLQADADMPLDELLKLYSKNASVMNNNTLSDEESYSSSDLEDDEEEEVENDNDRRHHLLHVNGELLPDNDDDDTEDSLYEPEVIKFINVGDEYQAHVESKAEYNSSNEDYDDREVPEDELLWSSSSVSDVDNENIDEYLKIIHTEYPTSDDEISLQILLNYQLNTDQALVKFRQLLHKKIYSYLAWSLTEIHQLEDGLREYGKDFYKISVYKCPNRSVREIIHFYYQWKKSERYHLFIDEQQRINSLNSVSDIIEKFIEKQEQQLCTAAGVVDSTKSPSSFLSNDYKFHAPLPSNTSISFVTIRQQETATTTTTITKRSFDQIDNDDETTLSSSKKTSMNSKASSTEATATIV